MHKVYIEELTMLYMVDRREQALATQNISFSSDTPEIFYSLPTNKTSEICFLRTFVERVKNARNSANITVIPTNFFTLSPRTKHQRFTFWELTQRE